MKWRDRRLDRAGGGLQCRIHTRPGALAEGARLRRLPGRTPELRRQLHAQDLSAGQRFDLRKRDPGTFSGAGTGPACAGGAVTSRRTTPSAKGACPTTTAAAPPMVTTGSAPGLRTSTCSAPPAMGTKGVGTARISSPGPRRVPVVKTKLRQHCIMSF